jgi:hypothetical protein
MLNRPSLAEQLGVRGAQRKVKTHQQALERLYNANLRQLVENRAAVDSGKREKCSIFGSHLL